VFLPRRKPEEGPDGQRHIRVSYEALEGLFHLPLKDAAREIGLCPTTFKKACRRFNLEHWPFRQFQGRIPFARRTSQTDGVDAAMRTLHQDPVCATAAPTLQTTDAHQAMRAGTVSCTSPVWHDGISSSAAPQGLLQQASMALDMRSYGEARHAGPAFEHFAPLDAPSYIDTLTRGRVVIGVPQPCPSLVWRDISTSGVPLSSIASSSSHVRASSELDCLNPFSAVFEGLLRKHTSSFGSPFCSIAISSSNGRTSTELHRDRATPLETGPPRERPCVEAVMDYLDLGCCISRVDVESIVANDIGF